MTTVGGAGGGRKVPKKCHVLFESPLTSSSKKTWYRLDFSKISFLHFFPSNELCYNDDVSSMPFSNCIRTHCIRTFSTFRTNLVDDEFFERGQVTCPNLKFGICNRCK